MAMRDPRHLRKKKNRGIVRVFETHQWKSKVPLFPPALLGERVVGLRLSWGSKKTQDTFTLLSGPEKKGGEVLNRKSKRNIAGETGEEKPKITGDWKA